MDTCGVCGQPTTVKNSAANGLIEQVHLTIGDQLRMITFEGSDFHDELDQIIQVIALSFCTTVPSNLPYSSAKLVFGMDMIFRQKAVIDWEMIEEIFIPFLHEPSAPRI